MEYCKYCDATFSSRQSRWRHEKTTCPRNFWSQSRRGDEVTSAPNLKRVISTLSDSNSEGPYTIDERSRSSTTSNNETDHDHSSGDASVDEIGNKDERVLLKYAQLQLMQLFEDAEDEKEFRGFIAEEIRRNKAVRSTRWFKELNTIVNRLIDKGYDFDEAIAAAVQKRKFMIKQMYAEYKNDEHATKRLKDYNRIITNYS